ncbi:hypothetical protein [Planomonospora sp. ID82291]|uniref:hypothetical protein n=1 Tax=Planomonospora sp. ID82291 TaxID=2738136 RepID=UPI0018C3DF0B|nr:hypothetical protein [Planomonospora sp. ID82291]MBG0818428.1 hypothetical protein [Planomonospora sp. ID82291]
MFSGTAPAYVRPDLGFSFHHRPGPHDAGAWVATWHGRLTVVQVQLLRLHQLARPGAVTFSRTDDGAWTFTVTARALADLTAACHRWQARAWRVQRKAR